MEEENRCGYVSMVDSETMTELNNTIELQAKKIMHLERIIKNYQEYIQFLDEHRNYSRVKGKGV